MIERLVFCPKNSEHVQCHDYTNSHLSDIASGMLRKP